MVKDERRLLDGAGAAAVPITGDVPVVQMQIRRSRPQLGLDIEPQINRVVRLEHIGVQLVCVDDPLGHAAVGGCHDRTAFPVFCHIRVRGSDATTGSGMDLDGDLFRFIGERLLLVPQVVRDFAGQDEPRLEMTRAVDGDRFLPIDVGDPQEKRGF